MKLLSKALLCLSILFCIIGIMISVIYEATLEAIIWSIIGIGLWYIIKVCYRKEV